MFLGTRIIVSDILTDPLWEGFRDAAGRHGLRACWSTPILSMQRKVLGSFAMYYDEPRSPNDDELRLIESAADVARIAIERERAQEALRQSEARHRLLYDNTPSMFFTIDVDGIVRGVNRFATEHLGYSAEELVGQSVLRVVHPQDHVVVKNHLEACFADPGTVHVLSFRKIRKNGSMIWVKEVTRVVDGPDGASALIICEDVTEARAHEEAARRAATDVHHKDEFMAMLGHELRNPLSPIVTALEILRRRGLVDPELEVIDRQVSHLRRLVDDLLDVSRITRGKVELHKERVELAVVASQAVEVARPVFQRKRQTLRVAFAPRGLAVDADPARLVQAFANLLTNAGKYSEEGTDVHFSAERQGDRIVVRVRDQGEGIEPEMLDRVFDLFVQRPQPPDRAQSGLGLGLTIVRNLIALHGGTVRALSEGRGKGTTVEADLPAAAGEPQLPTMSFAAGSANRAPGPETGVSVLVVDDNEDVRESLCKLLTLLGYRASSVHDGPSALQMADRIKPQVAMVDIGLPGMDGYEVARRLRRAHPTGLRLVAVTGYGQESDRARSHEAGFDAHLVKPIDLDALLPQLVGPA
jgi:PAS domain S-box-containing protein